MIGYRFLSPADEEMTAASLFYELLREDWEMISLMTSNRQSKGCVSILTPAKHSLVA